MNYQPYDDNSCNCFSYETGTLEPESSYHTSSNQPVPTSQLSIFKANFEDLATKSTYEPGARLNLSKSVTDQSRPIDLDLGLSHLVCSSQNDYPQCPTRPSSPESPLDSDIVALATVQQARHHSSMKMAIEECDTERKSQSIPLIQEPDQRRCKRKTCQRCRRGVNGIRSCIGSPVCKSCMSLTWGSLDVNLPPQCPWIVALKRTLQELTRLEYQTNPHMFQSEPAVAASYIFWFKDCLERKPEDLDMLSLRQIPHTWDFRSMLETFNSEPSISLTVLDRIATSSLRLGEMWSKNRREGREREQKLWFDIHQFLAYVILLYHCRFIFILASDSDSFAPVTGMLAEIFYAIGWRMQEIQTEILRACELALLSDEEVISGQVLFYGLRVFDNVVRLIQYPVDDNPSQASHPLMKVHRHFAQRLRDISSRLAALECELSTVYAERAFTRDWRPLPEVVRSTDALKDPVAIFRESIVTVCTEKGQMPWSARCPKNPISLVEFLEFSAHPQSGTNRMLDCERKRFEKPDIDIPSVYMPMWSHPFQYLDDLEKWLRENNS